jgi:Kdo2-lipid IVA lauroyltransferase/acyltransferase
MYFLSDGIYGLVYYIFGYRKKIVAGNIALAFPEKTVEERKKIEKQFYHQLIDTFIEIIKLISISKEQIQKRVSCDYSLIDKLYKTGQSVQFHCGHFFSWEFINLAVAANIQYPFLGIYAPLSNRTFDRIIYSMRKKFGTVLVPTNRFRTHFKEYAGDLYSLGLAADQNPRRTQEAYWMPFMGKLAPFVPGPEKGAKLHNTAIVFANFYPVKRGYYALEFTLYTTVPNQIEDGKITIDFKNFVEQQIRERPANYLWSHRRWKWNYDPSVHAEHLLES